MDNQIKITEQKGKLQFDVDRFNLLAAVEFETQVKPKIAKAKNIEFPKGVIKCNNPV